MPNPINLIELNLIKPSNPHNLSKPKPHLVTKPVVKMRETQDFLFRFAFETV